MQIFSQRIDNILAFVGIVFAMLFLYLFGVLGLFKSGAFGFDFAVFYKAGTNVLEGVNPWLHANLHQPFSYPPQALTLFSFYALMPYDVALVVHTLVNLISVAVLGCLANIWFLKIKKLSDVSLVEGICFAIIIGNPFMAHSVYEGQLVLPVTALIFLSWHTMQKGQWLVPGLLLAAATIKPQISLLYVCWLVASGQFRVILSSGFFVALLCIPAAIIVGPVDMFVDWITSITGYYTSSANAIGSPHVVGLESFLYAIGLSGLTIISKPLALIALLWLYFNRRHFDHVQLVNIFLVIGFTFLYAHDTDYAAIILLWSYAMYLALNSRSILNISLLVVLLIVFFFPQRILRDIDLPVLHHTRTLVIPLCCFLVHYLYKKYRTQNAAVMA